MDKFIKIILSIIFVLAIVFGLVQNHSNFFGSKTLIQKFSTSDGNLQDYYLRGQQLASNNQTASTTVTFLAVGDIMLSRTVGQLIQDNKDINYPFAHLTEIFNPLAGSSSFNFGNLESPVAPAHPIIGGHTMVFGANADYLAGLKKANFKILNLANNHAFDQGLAGLIATKSALDSLGIGHEGTGQNLGEAWEPAVVNADGLKICFVGASYSSINDSGKTKNDYVARIDQLDWLKTAVTTAKQKCDFTVVTMHAGTEYTRTPNPAQTTFAHAAIDDGADVVIGAHPHWVQTVEKYCPAIHSLPSSASDEGRVREGLQPADNTTSPLPLSLKGEGNCTNPKYIFYSLGNFVFDQNFSQDTKEGLTLKITISKSNAANPVAPNAASADDLQGQRNFAKLEQIELLPAIITNSQPRPANSEETKIILQKIGQNENILK